MSWKPPSTEVLERDAIMFIESQLYFCPLATPPPPSQPLQLAHVSSTNTVNNNVNNGSANNSSRAHRPPVIFVRSDRRTDKRYHYQPFFSDFGPPDLGAVFRFCDEMDAHLSSSSSSSSTSSSSATTTTTTTTSTGKRQRVVHCVADNPNARSNGAFLTAAYVVLRHGRSAQQAFAPLLGIYPPIAPFRDASYGLSDFTITVLDCLKSLCRAISCNMLNTMRFDSESYTHYSRVENGDWNWLVVDQLIAFSGPMNERR